MSNEAIGSWVCDAGGKADVFQSKRRGRHFYTRCECCGLNQSTGPFRQKKIWDEANFYVGVSVFKPNNVVDGEVPPTKKTPHELPKPEGQESELSEEDEEYKPDALDAEVSKTKETSASFGLVAALVLVASGVGGFIWTNKPKI